MKTLAAILLATMTAIGPNGHLTIKGAADNRINQIRNAENRYNLMPLEKFSFSNNTWGSRAFTEEELLGVNCSSEERIGLTTVQYCVEQVAGARPNLIIKIVSEKSIKLNEKKDIYNQPIMVTLYDYNSDGIDEGDIIKTRYRGSQPVNYTMGFNGTIHETWEAMSCGQFKIVKSGEASWFFRKLIGLKRPSLNQKYENLLHSDSHANEARDFAEKLADITRAKIIDYTSDNQRCK